MTDTSGRVLGWGRSGDGGRPPRHGPPRPVVRHHSTPARREMPHWLPMAAGTVLVWWPVTFVFGLLDSGIWLLLVSMVLALLSIPALVVLLVRADHRSKAATRRRSGPSRR